ncbi:pyridoxamine 5'-phosphate oxidase family protein [Aquimarina sp. ERC-38]|uniref:pyridoxamine 5'-phosphate oxidase family protein n=1 Tax=Aquimarina sp. ERC-38 TaxID=2949996 RepID=UPI002246AEEF|nr:pyridoxamine 5'-phosphate oxidase family protein [Aquimarina sp. ERC-38]UZO79332.1 pyridoxamine 5'-phosphate oxidase family protein [Aquimarina sp. ERC-38]
MLTDIFNQIHKDFKGAVKYSKHAFRYATLATVADGLPFQRTIVLRDVTDTNDLLIYTDERSKKVAQLKRNKNASLLFYDHNRLTQVILRGTISIETKGEGVEERWQKVRERSQKDYITSLGPGIPVDNPDQVTYLKEQNYFTILNFVPDEIEYLRLKRPNHIRALFTKSESEEWDMTFLVP